MDRLRIAVIGSGISGLSCAWALSQRHEVVVFEAETRLGGHSHTVDVTLDGGQVVPVDTGFIVSNTWTYPNFTALMDYLDVPMVESVMSFSVSANGGRYEYSGDHLGTLFGTKHMWLSPSHWRMMADLVRFYRTAAAEAPSIGEEISLGKYLHMRGFGQHFIQRHILPMAGAIWSATPQEIADYPFRAFIRFFSNHKLFALGDRPSWRTVKGGSRTYVNRLVADGRFSARVSSPVQRVQRFHDHVIVHFWGAPAERFDHAVLATHGDQARRLLGNPTPQEAALLEPFKTSANRVVLHRDASLMPKHRRFWSSWNYRGDGNGKEASLAVTYWMNRLQSLESPADHFVSLNPECDPNPELVDGVYAYRHPIMNDAVLNAQQALWSLQGVNRTWFAGAWFGSGFHEDGLQAGLAVAEQLGGVRRPWVVENESGRIHVSDVPATVPEPLAIAAE